MPSTYVTYRYAYKQYVLDIKLIYVVYVSTISVIVVVRI